MPKLPILLKRSFVIAVLLALLGLGGMLWFRSTRPDHLLRRGQQALRQGDFKQAERLATRLEHAGHKDHAHLLRCELAFRGHNYARAVEEFNQIQDQGELLVEASAVCGRWFLLELHRPAEAERFLRFVVSRQPNNIDAHRGLATVYYDQRAWIPAVLHLLKWAELDPRDGRAHRFMGLIYKDLDQPTPAVNSYEEALRRQLTAPVREEVKEELAECLVAQSHYERALALLEDCGERSNKVPKLIALRGECLWGLGRTPQAQAVVDGALAEHPSAPELLRFRAKIYLGTNEVKAAIPLLEHAVKIDRNDYSGRYQLAQAYQALDRPADAALERRFADATKASLQQLTDLIQKASDKPWDAEVRQRLAQLCQKLDKPKLAEMWRRAAENCPKAAMTNHQATITKE